MEPLITPSEAFVAQQFRQFLIKWPKKVSEKFLGGVIHWWVLMFSGCAFQRLLRLVDFLYLIC